MTVELRPEEQRIVNDAVRSGEYQKPEDVISDAPHAWRQQRSSMRSGAENGERKGALARPRP